jgi:hypothetical protein
VLSPTDALRHQRSYGVAEPPGRPAGYRCSLDLDGSLARSVAAMNRRNGRVRPLQAGSQTENRQPMRPWISYSRDTGPPMAVPPLIPLRSESLRKTAPVDRDRLTPSIESARATARVNPCRGTFTFFPRQSARYFKLSRPSAPGCQMDSRVRREPSDRSRPIPVR